eukprot:scaffold36249_cov17-Tisochrysis_lutea.AAC.2
MHLWHIVWSTWSTLYLGCTSDLGRHWTLAHWKHIAPWTWSTSCPPFALLPSGSIKFRGPARWSGMSLMAKSAFRGEGAEHDLVAAATQTHHMFLLDVAAQ